MANIKSNIKSSRQSIKRHNENKQKISKLKTLIKKAIKSNNTKDLNNVYSYADNLCSKKIIHANKVNRIKSRVTKNINKIKFKTNATKSINDKKK